MLSKSSSRREVEGLQGNALGGKHGSGVSAMAFRREGRAHSRSTAQFQLPKEPWQ